MPTAATQLREIQFSRPTLDMMPPSSVRCCSGATEPLARNSGTRQITRRASLIVPLFAVSYSGGPRAKVTRETVVPSTKRKGKPHALWQVRCYLRRAAQGEPWRGLSRCGRGLCSHRDGKPLTWSEDVGGGKNSAPDL
jgi:hypothetical protein